MAGLATGDVPTSTGFSLLPSEGVDPNNGPGVGGTAGGAGGGSSSSSINSDALGILPTPTSSQMNILPSASPTNSFSSLSAPKVLVFNDKANFGPNNTGRVFPAQNRTKTFAWTYAKTNTTLLDIFWYGRQVNTGEAFDVSQASVIAHAKFGDSTPGNEFAKHTGLSSGEWYEREMVIKIDWKTQSGDEGFTQSGVFTVANGPFDSEAFGREATDNSQDKQGGEATTSIGNPSLPTSGPSGTGNGIGGGSSSGDRSGGGGGGLSKGAIAGIAVACSVVGILLIAGLVWFLLRRRRRRHFDGGYNAAHQTTSSFIATKEARPSVVESPVISPFTDNDNSRAIGPGSGSNAIPIPLHHNAAAGTNDPVSPQDDRRPSTAASGNRSRNIAHLVEEGMTEADILRLEEEERHLDAEIERAARRTSR
ncbi:hypothetical protein BBK36DRAFT_22048 [Trichoderma citrinoviride]|uniref:Uncharacterized protein n=1 Tax=Trichoderma citrinoviride TaxID=58853 RepID=A0A2T4B521_9HYPO|nr:hypothetical protein BBK36DRAFT_22048 [Trichoderma citrinoviride]PTB64436.1 hypothetical protein BBK36DRAFT_22048 [Trichoderma citrinoviride]